MAITAVAFRFPFKTAPNEAAPGTPTGFTAAVSGPLQVTVSWNALSSSDISSLGVTGYSVKRLNPDLSITAVTVSTSVTSYVWNSLTRDTLYTFGVSSVMSGGESDVASADAVAIGFPSL